MTLKRFFKIDKRNDLDLLKNKLIEDLQKQIKLLEDIVSVKNELLQVKDDHIKFLSESLDKSLNSNDQLINELKILGRRFESYKSINK